MIPSENSFWRALISKTVTCLKCSFFYNPYYSNPKDRCYYVGLSLYLVYRVSIINKACIKVIMLRVTFHEKKQNKTKQNKTKRNMLLLPVEVVLLENLKMHLKFTIDEVTASTIYM